MYLFKETYSKGRESQRTIWALGEWRRSKKEVALETVWVEDAVSEPAVWNKEKVKPIKAEQPAVAGDSSIHGLQDPLHMAFAVKGGLCLPGRHQCPQHETCAASGQTTALASSLETTNSEPAAVLSISRIKRLFHKDVDQEKRHTCATGQPRQPVSGALMRYLLDTPKTIWKEWGDQGSNRALEVEAEPENI